MSMGCVCPCVAEHGFLCLCGCLCTDHSMVLGDSALLVEYVESKFAGSGVALLPADPRLQVGWAALLARLLCVCVRVCACLQCVCVCGGGGFPLSPPPLAMPW